MPRRKPQSSWRTILRHQPLCRRREPPHLGHDIGPVYWADIVIVPPLRSILLISYWGRPKTISESVKTYSPKNVTTLGSGSAPVFDQEPSKTFITSESASPIRAILDIGVRFSS